MYALDSQTPLFSKLINYMPPMKICLVTQRMGTIQSGPDLYAHNVLNNMINNGHDVTVISQRSQVEPDSSFSFIGVDSTLFNNNQARWIGLSRAFNKALKEIEKHHQMDIIHFTDVRIRFFAVRNRQWLEISTTHTQLKYTRLIIINNIIPIGSLGGFITNLFTGQKSRFYQS